MWSDSVCLGDPGLLREAEVPLSARLQASLQVTTRWKARNRAGDTIDRVGGRDTIPSHGPDGFHGPEFCQFPNVLH